MMTCIELYDRDTIDQMKWPETEEAHLAKAFLLK